MEENQFPRNATRAYLLTLNYPGESIYEYIERIQESQGERLVRIIAADELGPRFQTPHFHFVIEFAEPVRIGHREWRNILHWGRNPSIRVPAISLGETDEQFLSNSEIYVKKDGIWGVF